MRKVGLDLSTFQVVVPSESDDDSRQLAKHQTAEISGYYIGEEQAKESLIESYIAEAAATTGIICFHTFHNSEAFAFRAPYNMIYHHSILF